jgi:hypothetical protein
MAEADNRGRTYSAIRPYMPAWKNLRDMVISFFTGPVISVLPFIRSNIGYRTISLFTIWTQFAFFMMVTFWSFFFTTVYKAYTLPTHTRVSGFSLFHFMNPYPLTYGVCFVILALIERRSRWDELGRGKFWFTYSRGVSRLHPLFPNVGRPDYVERFADPALVFVAAVVALPFSYVMAAWLLYCAVATFLVEQLIADKILDETLDVIDNALLAEAHEQAHRHLREGQAASAQASMHAAAQRGFSINTDAQDIQDAIARRKRREQAEQAQQTPEAAATVAAGAAQLEAPEPAQAYYEPPQARSEAKAPARPMNRWLIVAVFLVPVLIVAGYFGMHRSTSPGVAQASAAPFIAAGVWKGSVQLSGGQVGNVDMALQEFGGQLAGTLSQSVIGGAGPRFVIYNVTGQAISGALQLNETSIRKQSAGSRWCLVTGLRFTPQPDSSISASWSPAKGCEGGKMALRR